MRAGTWDSSRLAGTAPLALDAAKALGSSQARSPRSATNRLWGMLAAARRSQALHSQPPQLQVIACNTSSYQHTLARKAAGRDHSSSAAAFGTAQLSTGCSPADEEGHAVRVRGCLEHQAAHRVLLQRRHHHLAAREGSTWAAARWARAQWRTVWPDSRPAYRALQTVFAGSFRRCLTLGVGTTLRVAG